MWLSTEGLEVGQLDEDRMAAFLLARHETGHPRVPGRRAMAPLLGYLREVGVTLAGRPPLTPLDALLGRYRSWMVRERNLAPSTVLRYENTARRFLLEQVSDGETFEPAALTGIDINAFCSGNVVGFRLDRPSRELLWWLPPFLLLHGRASGTSRRLPAARWWPQRGADTIDRSRGRGR